MEINRQLIKALSANTRLKILKSLSDRRKMPSEIQKELKLSSSTIIEHLKILASADLIKRIETGHKWIYYELTDKGINIVQPNMPAKFILTLAIGIVLITSTVFKIFNRTTYTVFDNVITDNNITSDYVLIQESKIPEVTNQIILVDWVYLIIFVLGLILVVFSLYKILKRKK